MRPAPGEYAPIDDAATTAFMPAAAAAPRSRSVPTALTFQVAIGSCCGCIAQAR